MKKIKRYQPTCQMKESKTGVFIKVEDNADVRELHHLFKMRVCSSQGSEKVS